jgi:hypothetical protein
MPIMGYAKAAPGDIPIMKEPCHDRVERLKAPRDATYGIRGGCERCREYPYDQGIGQPHD